ncbi:extracellular solute-binding protein [Modestobacter sp. Leaf380]|uniref:extracellular solute-binding protein n=1 Tax=Modestobacter sp. Leaf380 TaxID=1736356 RepID=UPI0006F78B14|nr:extracellular solute-binding protein [Modestobacter sp. Leaf380]KQS66208.1 hypothetical protein ASG41_12835 [Modestobacter sp. Leaf380]
MRSYWSPRRTAVLAAGTLVLAVAGCGEATDDTGTAAAAPASTCEAGTVAYGETDPEVEASTVDDEALVVYSGRDEELVAPVLEQFTEETGIEVSVRYGSTSSITAQLLEEGADSPADVVLLQDAGALGALADADCLAELPDETVGQTFAEYADDDRRWVPLTGRARVVLYDPQQVAEADLPADTAALVDPAYAGQVAIAPGNASFQAFVTAMRVLEDDATAEEFLQGLVDGAAPVYDGNGAILDAVEAGEVPMGLVNHYYWFEQAAEVGADAMRSQLHYLRDGQAGSLVNVSGSGVVSSSDRAEDGLTLVDFLLSTQAQEYFAQETYEYPMVSGVPVADQLPSLEDLDAPTIDLDDLASLSVTLQMITASGLA